MKRRFKRNILILAGVFGAFTWTADAQQAVTKIGIINIQGAIAGTKDGKKALQDLDQKIVPKRKEFESRRSEVAQLQDQYNKGSAVMSEDKRIHMARDIQEKKKRLDRDIQDADEDLKYQQQKIMQDLGGRIMTVIEKYAKDNGYTMILDVGNPNTPVLYASSGINITQNIISLYDKNTSNGNPAPTAAPAPKPSTSGPAAAAKPPKTPR